MHIGQRFAELDVQVLVMKLLQQFELKYQHEPMELVTPRNIKM